MVLPILGHFKMKYNYYKNNASIIQLETVR